MNKPSSRFIPSCYVHRLGADRVRREAAWFKRNAHNCGIRLDDHAFKRFLWHLDDIIEAEDDQHVVGIVL